MPKRAPRQVGDAPLRSALPFSRIVDPSLSFLFLSFGFVRTRCGFGSFVAVVFPLVAMDLSLAAGGFPLFVLGADAFFLGGPHLHSATIAASSMT